MPCSALNPSFPVPGAAAAAAAGEVPHWLVDWVTYCRLCPADKLPDYAHLHDLIDRGCRLGAHAPQPPQLPVPAALAQPAAAMPKGHPPALPFRGLAAEE